jgi:hypothetical protein
MAKKHGAEKATKNKALGYDTDELEELPPSPPKKRVRENPFTPSSARHHVVSSDEEDIPRDAKKKDKGKAVEREDKHEGSDAKKKGKATEREESPDKKKKRDESPVGMDVRRSPRKKPAQYDDNSDVAPVKTPLKQGQLIAPSRSRAYRRASDAMKAGVSP